jgi:hypothetical protein
MIKVTLDRDEFWCNQDDIYLWCNEHFGRRYFDDETREWKWDKDGHHWEYHTIFGSGFFRFSNKEDAAFFMLRWGGISSENRD